MANNELLRAKDRLRQALKKKKGIFASLTLARHHLSKMEFMHFAEWLNKTADISLLPSLPAKRGALGSLYRYQPLNAILLDRELEWQFSFLRLQEIAIQKYVAGLANLEEKWTNNHLDTADLILEQMSGDSGEACRIHEIRLALIKHRDGAVAQKVYIGKILENIPAAPFTQALIALASERNEDEVYLPRFIGRVQRLISEQKPDIYREALLRFKLMQAQFRNSSEWAALLSISATGGLIDSYEAFFHTCCEVLRRTAFHKGLIRTNMQEEESRQLKSLKRYADFFISAGDLRYLNILECTRLALEESSTHAVGKNPRENPTIQPRSGAIEFLRSVCFDLPYPDSMPGHSFWIEHWTAVRSIVTRSEEIEHSLFGTIKFAINNSHLPRSGDLLEICFSFSGDRRSCSPILHLFPTDPLHPILRGIVKRDFVAANNGAPYVSQWSRDLLRYLTDKTALQTGIDTSAPAAIEAILIKTDLEEVSETECWEALNESAAKKFEYAHWESERLRFHTALKSENFLDALVVATSACIKNDSRRHEFDLSPVFKKTKWKQLSSLSHSMSLPVGLFLYLTDYDDPEAHFNLRLALCELLDSQSCLRPSDLTTNSEFFNQALLVFFLERVCIGEYLELVPDLESTRSVEEERLKILLWLMDSNPASRMTYEEELKGISARLTIDDGLNEFDRSRVHVDISGIQKWADRELQEDFERLQSLVKSLDPNAINAFKLLENALADGTAIPTEFNTLSDSRERQTLSLMQQLYYQFQHNKPYGLDTHLSLRIRHGSFSGYLRSVLETNGLISTLDSSTGRYQIPSVWINSMSEISNIDKKAVEDAFNTFSKNIDAELNRTVNELIQIFSESKPKGLFSAPILVVTVKVTSALVQHKTTLKDFVSLCFLSFLSSLETSLDAIRSHMQTQFKTVMFQHVATLQSSLANTALWREEPRMNWIIGQGRTQLVEMIDRVAGWFTFFDYRSATRSYTLDEVVDIAIAAVSNTHKGKELPIIKNIDQDLARLSATSLQHIVDPLFIMLDNAQKYGDTSCTLPITVAVTRINPARIQLLCRNKLRRDTPFAQLQEKLQQVRSEINNESSGKRLVTEGGTGLVKLSRMGLGLTDEAINHTAEFFINEIEMEFIASINLEYKEISSTAIG